MRILLAAIAALLVGACGNGNGDSPAAPGDLVFRSEKGDHVLRIVHLEQLGPDEELPAASLSLDMVFDLQEDCFLEPAEPFCGAMLPDGKAVGAGANYSNVDGIGGRVAITRLLLGAEREKLSALEVRCLLMKITKWEDLAFEGLGPAESDFLSCGPFALKLAGEEEEARITAVPHGDDPKEFMAYREKVPLELVDFRFALQTLKVVDAKARELTLSGQGGGDGDAFGMYRVPVAEGEDAVAVAYPVTVSIRVPLEYEEEEVFFKMTDLPLPPVEKR